MKYQRVLYTNKFTTELKSKLRIVSYDKRRSLKGNVYYVSFASNADIEYADRTTKHLRDVTLKPFQSHYVCHAQYENRMKTIKHQESLVLPPVPSSSSPTSFPSLSTTLSFLDDCPSACIASEFSSLRYTNETLDERVNRILGSRILVHTNVASTSILPAPNSKKEQIIDDVQSCLDIMKATRQAADELCHLYKHGADSRDALNHLFELHSTSFYMKVTTSAQIKAAFLAGLRLPWPTIVNSIHLLKMDIDFERTFMEQTKSAKYISSKINSTASIAMSSKLAYQLTKLSS